MPRKESYADVKLIRKLAWQLKVVLALALVIMVGVLGSMLGRADVTAREPVAPIPQAATPTPVPPEPVVKVSPTTVLPNEAMIITGTGFTTGSGITIDKITIGGVDVPKKNVNEGAVVGVDSAGNFGISIIIPVNTTTLTTGLHTVSAFDSKGRSGRTTLAFPNRVFKVDPETSRRGSSVTVTGASFPVSSTRPTAEPNPSVQITYEITGRDPKTVATISTNASGEFTASFLVPLDAPIPSSNTVRALVVGTTVSETKPHSIPDRSITVSPDSGPTGTAIRVTGSNFPAFTPVRSLTIGRIQALPSSPTSTNAEGSFTASTVVPELPVGTQPVEVEVGDSTALVSFRMTASPATPVPAKPTTPAALLAPLGANLVRVWGFDATKQAFQLYDPAAPTLSDLTALVQGRGYWVLVNRDQAVTLGSGAYTLSAGWNNIGWLG